MNKRRLPLKNIISGSVFALLFVLTCVLGWDLFSDADWRCSTGIQALSLLELFLALVFFVPKRGQKSAEEKKEVHSKGLSKRTLLAMLFVLLVVPLTIFIGIYYLGDKKYYFISLMIIVETLLPFFVILEKRRPKARELVIISVLCGLAVAGRTVFTMLPQFKPLLALVIISGVCFGGETGFLVGAVAGFVSNFFFGQGPWTPWQMFAAGIIGFFAGILFDKGLLRKKKAPLCIFGFLSTLVLYGGIMNPASVLMWQPNPTREMILSGYVMGLPFDLIHGAGVAFFLWFLAEPMIDKLERVKAKYGLISGQKSD